MFTAFMLNWFFIILFMFAIWGWYLRIGNPGVVDVGWVGCFLIVALSTGLTHMHLKAMLSLLVILIWGLRLGGYLYWTRVRAKEVDQRYISLSEGWSGDKQLTFLMNYQFQGILALLISLPVIYIALSPADSISILDMLLLLLALVAVVLEAMADNQLYQFKKAGFEGVCNTGLWAHSRHPNLFFELVFWFSITLYAINSFGSILLLASPLLLVWVMVKLTIPITETQSLSSRGEDYAAYQRATPMLVPSCLMTCPKISSEKNKN